MEAHSPFDKPSSEGAGKRKQILQKNNGQGVHFDVPRLSTEALRLCVISQSVHIKAAGIP